MRADPFRSSAFCTHAAAGFRRAAVATVAFALFWLGGVEQARDGSVRLRMCAVAAAQIEVTIARIGCLDIQRSGNLTSIVKRACDGKLSCAYKAPTPTAYAKAGVSAATRAFCTQAMEISWRCRGGAGAQRASVPGDAWNHPAAQLACAAKVATPKPPKNPELVPILRDIAKKYERCMIERYETAKTSRLPVRDGSTCADGKACTLASRGAAYRKLQQLVRSGDPTDFERWLRAAGRRSAASARRSVTSQCRARTTSRTVP